MKKLAILALLCWAAVAEPFSGDSYRRQSLMANFTTTAATATDTPLASAIAANAIYEVSGQLTAQGGLGGLKYAIKAPTGAIIEGWILSSTVGLTTLSYQRVTAINTLNGQALHTTAGTPGPDQMWLRVKNGPTKGFVVLQVASVTAGQTATLFAGSFWRVVEGIER
jgi:hypothetical protein